MYAIKPKSVCIVQVNVVHISATAKNAADDKIRQSLRRFADTHPAETKVILISSELPSHCMWATSLKARHGSANLTKITFFKI